MAYLIRTHQRAVMLDELALGPEHPDFAETLLDYRLAHRCKRRRTPAPWSCGTKAGVSPGGVYKDGKGREALAGCGRAVFLLGSRFRIGFSILAGRPVRRSLRGRRRLWN